MGIFSKTCEYAMRAMFYIAQRSQDGHRSGIKDIAEHIDSPEHFLAKILQKLSKDGLVRSAKGPNGGFYLDTAGLTQPLARIVAAFEGEKLFTGCGLGLSYCSEDYPCPLHHEFKEVRNKLIHMLNNTTIGQFNDELIAGQLTLNK